MRCEMHPGPPGSSTVDHTCPSMRRDHGALSASSRLSVSGGGILRSASENSPTPFTNSPTALAALQCCALDLQGTRAKI